MRDALLAALAETDEKKFGALAAEYVKKRKAFFALLAPDDKKYFNFQLWREGIARYTEVRAAEAAENYQPTAEDKRIMFYSFGAAEGFLLDRMRPDWKKQYFEHLFTLDEFFEK